MTTAQDSIFIGGGGAERNAPEHLLLRMANRHGLIAGATGTGKTVTLQTMAQSLSDAGVPVFLADIKGDLSGLAAPGDPAHKLHPKLVSRAEAIGMGPLTYAAGPCVFWDLAGEEGHPLRATVSEMGPLLISRLLELNDVQEGVLNVVFRIADEEGLLLVDLKDLRAMLVEVASRAAELSVKWGHVSQASVGAIQRKLLSLENQGAAAFFGEPAVALADMIRTGADGRGQINVLAARRLMAQPKLYAAFLLWLLSELFEELPEVGDPDKPRLVFFFDEAHLLFDRAPRSLVDKVEQVARLIRSKGVGVWFVSQNPGDIPDDVLGQLGGRVMHALRAYTPRDRKALRAAADSFRDNPSFSAIKAIPQLGVGEALVSMLDAKGAPGMAQQVLIRPPSSRLGPLSDDERAAVIAASPIAGRYETAVDRHSAYEALAARAAKAAEAAPMDRHEAEPEARAHGRRYSPSREYQAETPAPRPAPKRMRRSGGDDIATAFAKSVMRSMGSSLGRRIARGILGGLFKGR
jgi:DNA helicase HerA-like ATPase